MPNGHDGLGPYRRFVCVLGTGSRLCLQERGTNQHGESDAATSSLAKAGTMKEY